MISITSVLTAAMLGDLNAARPNLIVLVADDLGHNDVGWANNRTITPNLDALVAGGVELMQFYVFKYCAPTRGALQTGRYPYHFGFYTNQDANDYGVPTNYTYLPAKLKELGGYRTHAIGKWHNGFRSKELTPTYRGYDSYLGYYHMEEDYWTHKFGKLGKGGKHAHAHAPGLSGIGCDGSYTDFSNNSGASINVLWGHGGTPGPATGTRASALGRTSETCNITKNQCIHAFVGQIKNFSSSSADDCCTACKSLSNCAAWNWNHPNPSQGTPGGLCALKDVQSGPNPGSIHCDYGYVNQPPAPPAPPAPAPPAPPDKLPESDYSADIFANEAIRIFDNHAKVYAPQGTPFFMYLAMQSVHGPYEAPKRFVDMYGGSKSTNPHFIADSSRRTHQGMVTALDEAIGNVTDALKNTGLWENTFIWFTTDNGGPLPTANNFPLRGGKFTQWEGGTRVRSFVHCANPAVLPPGLRGTKNSALMHATDVYQTMISIAGLSSQFDPSSTGPVPFDGYDQYVALRTGNASASKRTEILYGPIVGGNDDKTALSPADCAGGRWGQNCGGGIRVGDYKLLVGYPGDARALALPAVEMNATKISAAEDAFYGITQEVRDLLGGGGGGPGLDGCNYTSGTGCPCHHLNGGPCLFNVVADPTESKNLAADPQFASIKASLVNRMAHYSASFMPPAGLVGDALATDSQLQCDFVKKNNAFEPYGAFLPWGTNWTD